MNKPEDNEQKAVFDVKPTNPIGKIKAPPKKPEREIPVLDLRFANAGLPPQHATLTLAPTDNDPVASQAPLPSDANAAEEKIEDDIMQFMGSVPGTPGYTIEQPKPEPPEPKPAPKIQPKPIAQTTSYVDQLIGSHDTASHKDLVLKELEEELADAQLATAMYVPATKQQTTTTSPQKQEDDEYWTPLNNDIERAIKDFQKGVHNAPTPPKQKEIVTPIPTPKQEPVAQTAVATKEVETFFRPKLIVTSAPTTLVADDEPTEEPIAQTQRSFYRPWMKKLGLTVLGIAFVGFAVALVNKGQIVITQTLENNGASAMLNLEYARENLLELNFEGAAQNFALAYDDFDTASSTLDKMGASLGSAISNIPGLSKVSTASDIAEAGQSLALAGENLSLAFDTLSERNILASVDPTYGFEQQSLSDTTKEFKQVLVFAQKHMNRAQTLLSKVDPNDLPEDKRAMFAEFNERLPEFNTYINGAISYADAMLAIVGDNGTKRYIILLSNNTELRPTGGFPGTYGIVTFKNGSLENIFVDDIYRIDEQIRENVVPPIPMQHITPTWGMRDAAWFAHFPASAKKTQYFYDLNGGGRVDGVIVVTPTVVERLLRITGPIALPEHDVVLDADNFLPVIQQDVEIDAPRSAPKQIVSDFAPAFLAEIAQQEQGSLVEVIGVLVGSLQEKHILAYFNSSELQEVARNNGFAGELKSAPNDYLHINISNIKGTKSDYVTDNAYELHVTPRGNNLSHELTITRDHRGGTSQYEFYNQTNHAYIRIYVPKGSVLQSVQGNTLVDHEPLVDYDALGFKRDQELDFIERSTTHPFEDVDVYDAFGKTVFGFWLDVRPQKTEQVTISYTTPYDPVSEGEYNLLWQKQAGTVDDRMQFQFALPQGTRALNVGPQVQTIGNNLIMNSDLTIDREIHANF